MSMVPHVEPGAQLGVNYYFRRKKKKLKSGEVREYIYLVKVVCENGKCKQQELGNIEEIEKIIIEHKKRNKRPYARRRGNRGGAPMVRPPGFEPGIAGLEDMQPMGKSASGESGNSNDQARASENKPGGTLPWPPREAFRDWLSQRVHPRTLKDYMLYFDRLQVNYPEGIPLANIQELTRHKWPRYVIRKITQYLWATGVLSLEEKARIEYLARAPKRLEAPRAPRVTVEEFKASLEKLGDVRYRLAYLIMYYSGARVEEAARLMQITEELEEIPREQALRSIGYVKLGQATRIAIHYNRGRKRCDFLWLPTWLLELLREKRYELNARALSTYARKHGAMLPKLVRKLHYQLMEELEVDKEIRDLIQNRPSGLSVGDIHYSRVIERADAEYERRILPFLEEQRKG